jgi:hypothetical protein
MLNIAFPSRRIQLIVALTLLIVSILVAGLVKPASAATGQICDQYGTTTQGSYVVMNNRWGTSATQCINVTNNGFQITRQDGTGNTSGAPVSYPAIYVGCHYGNCSPGTNLPMQISAISTANTSTTVSYPSSGTYDAAYDIWLNADTNVSGVQDTEIMIWLNRVGPIQPIGSNTGNVNLGGRNWAVWVGNNGQNNVVSYQSTGITSFSADIKPFILDAITRGSGFGNTSWYLTSMQMGFEPWVGGVGLAVNSFSATINGGGSIPTNTPSRATVTRTPTRTGPTPTRSSATATRTPTQSSGGGTTCSPVNATISAPFTFDGAGSFCWRINNIPSYINSWNTTSVRINGANFTNLWASPSQLPAKASDGYWYISYSSSVAWGHIEIR